MKAVSASVLALGLSCALCVGLSGCPEGPPPPFDTTGTYAGEWWGTSDDALQEITSCPLTMTLSQDLTRLYPGDHGVEGTVVVDYSCLDLPEWVGEVPPATVQVAGLLADDGTFSLVSGGCGTGICVVLGLTGQGADTDADGLMDTYAGQWTYTILLAGVPPFGVDGGFSVESQ